ncbi:MAG: NFYB/HAP3 family transcription factor subunit [Candidatus Micrarchaeaceae archaeon]
MYISESAIKRILKDAGAIRISTEAKKEFVRYLDKTSFEIAQKAVKLAEHAKRKTVNASDITLAIS